MNYRLKLTEVDELAPFWSILRSKLVRFETDLSCRICKREPIFPRLVGPPESPLPRAEIPFFKHGSELQNAGQARAGGIINHTEQEGRSHSSDESESGRPIKSFSSKRMPCQTTRGAPDMLSPACSATTTSAGR